MGTHSGCTDHTNQWFPTRQKMCDCWGITVGTYKGRQKKGWSMERILTTPVASNGGQEWTDHTGKVFSSFAAMCKAWNKPREVIKKRLDNNWSLKDALEAIGDKGKVADGPVYDHLGQPFGSYKAMADHYKMSYNAFSKRMAQKWSIKDILLTPVETRQVVYDHLGNPFPSIRARAEAWGLTENGFRSRINRGASVEEALTGKVKERKIWVGPLGDRHDNFEKLCAAYKSPKATVKHRMDLGYSLDDALLIPSDGVNRARLLWQGIDGVRRYTWKGKVCTARQINDMESGQIQVR